MDSHRGPAYRCAVVKALRLSHVEKLFPDYWRAFVPSPKRGYIERVREELISSGVLDDGGSRSFPGFCNVPRYFHPAASEEALALSLELICWYFFFDDPFDDGLVSRDEGERTIARMRAVLNDGNLPPDATPVERLCRQFRNRAALLSGDRPELFSRFIALCDEWVGSILPITRWDRGRLPQLHEYDRLRLSNVGILPEFALNEMIGGLRLDDTFLDRPEVRRLGELAALIIAYCNDTYSYEREAQRQTQLNSLELRRRHGGQSLAEAYEDQLARIREMVDELSSIEQALVADGLLGWSNAADTVESARRRREQTQYVDDIKAVVVGNHYWSLADGRYHSPSSPFVELISLAARSPRKSRLPPPRDRRR